MSGRTDHEVVVVGAGPTGLLLAAELTRRGVDTALVESRPGTAPGSRAIGVHPPVLAALEQGGATERILAAAVRVPRGVARSHGRVIGEVRFDAVPTRFPFVATVPQAVTEAAVSHGGPEPLRGTRVSALRDHGHHVEVVAGDRSTTARFVVVAAGASGRTLVREWAGVGVRTYRDRYLMADVREGGGEPDDAAVITLDRAGVLESFPLPAGGRRLVAWTGRRPVEERGPRRADTTDDAGLLSRLVRERTGDGMLAASVHEASAFGIRRALAARMRRGRVVLIGDTAHEVSPIGGQGMNLGLLDAATLAPLLVRALSADGDDELGGWERRRIASARTAARLAGLNTALGRPRAVVAQRLVLGALRGALTGPGAALPARAYTMGYDRDAAVTRRSSSP